MLFISQVVNVFFFFVKQTLTRFLTKFFKKALKKLTFFVRMCNRNLNRVQVHSQLGA